MSGDLAAQAFIVLRNFFFDENGDPKQFQLRDKRNTQDDPFDVLVYDVLENGLGADIECVRAPGPLVSPDMAILRPERLKSTPRLEIKNDSTSIVAIEVKKLERGSNGKVARASGLDYNSTPPCGTVRVYDGANSTLDIRGFYLFVCLEATRSGGLFELSALALCDGDILNADFKYYIDITGERSKDIGVGTYGDGANRNRPMVIFANPLGADAIDNSVTLIHKSADLNVPGIVKVGTITRTIATTNLNAEFTCYRSDLDADGSQFALTDPFPSAKNRSERTTGRGKFTVGIRVQG